MTGVPSNFSLQIDTKGPLALFDRKTKRKNKIIQSVKIIFQFWTMDNEKMIDIFVSDTEPACGTSRWTHREHLL